MFCTVSERNIDILIKNFFPVDSLILMTKTAYRDHFQIFPINKNKRKWPVEFSLPQDHPFPTQQLEKTLVRYLHFNNKIFTVEFLCAGFYPSTFVYSCFFPKI